MQRNLYSSALMPHYNTNEKKYDFGVMIHDIYEAYTSKTSPFVDITLKQNHAELYRELIEKDVGIKIKFFN